MKNIMLLAAIPGVTRLFLTADYRGNSIADGSISMRFLLLVFLCALASACVSLPELYPVIQSADTGDRPKVVGTRGPLSKQQTESVMASLKRQGGGTDLLERHLALEEAIAGEPLILGNEVSLLSDGPATYTAMLADLEAARDHINVEYYIIEDDEVGRRFAELLARKSSQGVSVNLMYDSVGSFNTPKQFFDRLRAAGVKVLEFNPVNPLKAAKGWSLNNRNHRKLLIIDGEIAFAGGINISNVYSSGSSIGSSGRARSGKVPGWRDTHVRIIGPAVAPLQQQFLAVWEKQRGELLPQRNWFPKQKREGKHPVRVISSSPGDAFPAIFFAYVSAITHAEKSVYLTMAYFVPDAQTVNAIKEAAGRGVDVKLILPSHTDFGAVFHAGRSYYSELLQAGVQIYEREEALLHSKTAIIDGVWSTVGSSNMDWRSYLHNEEINVVVLGSDFAQQMTKMFERDLAASSRIELEAWERRPLRTRVMEWAARLWEYWL